MLGDSLMGQKKYAEAEPLIISVYDGIKGREDKIPPRGKSRLEEAAHSTLASSYSNENSGVCTPRMIRPAFLYFAAQAFT